MNVWNGIGRLTKDIELKKTSGESSVTNFTLAVDNPYGKEESNNKVFFINCVAFNKTAEFASRCFRKGVRIGVTGHIQTRSWKDNEAKVHYSTEIVVEKLHFADGNNAFSNKSSLDDNEEFSL